MLLIAFLCKLGLQKKESTNYQKSRKFEEEKTWPWNHRQILKTCIDDVIRGLVACSLLLSQINAIRQYYNRDRSWRRRGVIRREVLSVTLDQIHCWIPLIALSALSVATFLFKKRRDGPDSKDNHRRCRYATKSQMLIVVALVAMLLSVAVTGKSVSFKFTPVQDER